MCILGVAADKHHEAMSELESKADRKVAREAEAAEQAARTAKSVFFFEGWSY